jgi:hypothetical protein
MSYGADAYVSFPISGSIEPPYLRLRVVEQCHSASLTAVAATSSAVLALPANPNRRHLIYLNVANNFALIAYGQPPTLALFSEVAPAIDKKTTTVNHFDMSDPTYTGPVYVMWDDTNQPMSGSMMFTEFTQ